MITGFGAEKLSQSDVEGLRSFSFYTTSGAVTEESLKEIAGVSGSVTPTQALPVSGI